jgi:hypothetical protein
MMVGVDVRRVCAEQPTETVQLGSHVSCHGSTRSLLAGRPPPREPTGGLFELDVEPDIQLGAAAGVRGRFGSPVPLYHQARARHNPALVRLRDPSAQAEVVCVDDQIGAAVPHVAAPPYHASVDLRQMPLAVIEEDLPDRWPA